MRVNQAETKHLVPILPRLQLVSEFHQTKDNNKKIQKLKPYIPEGNVTSKKA
jgi:hypothetical protein